MKKILLIDPWGIGNTSEYLNGLINGLCSIVDVCVVSNFYFKLDMYQDIKIKRWFFRFSEKMHDGKVRKIVRGMEYVLAYIYIVFFIIKHREYKTIHINWLLFYPVDIIFLKIFKTLNIRIIYTAHNVLPHIDGTRYIESLEKIYELCDRIIIHGVTIKEEFQNIFPKECHKLYISCHGCNLKPQIFYDENKVDTKISNKLKKYKKIFLFFGYIFNNKGVDRLVNIWNKEWDNALLVVAGKQCEKISDYDKYRNKIDTSENILEINGYVDDNTLNYLIDNSDIILLPYRHASMSGVVFTAADFSKPILGTDVGSIKEYIVNGEDSFIVNNTDEALSEFIHNLVYNVDNGRLKDMGKKLNENIKRKYSWNVIGMKIVKECY